MRLACIDVGSSMRLTFVGVAVAIGLTLFDIEVASIIVGFSAIGLFTVVGMSSCLYFISSIFCCFFVYCVLFFSIWVERLFSFFSDCIISLLSRLVSASVVALFNCVFKSFIFAFSASRWANNSA